ncbi:MAG: metalloregulator ArsR/SmtB family transcription factor [Siculibacillus sp.]
METKDLVDLLSALAQATRLEAVRRLAAAEPAGLAAGELARALDVPANTLSTHLAVLAHAGLVTAERNGRSVIYRADVDRLRFLADGLLADCCGGRPDLCSPSRRPADEIPPSPSSVEELA